MSSHTNATGRRRRWRPTPFIGASVMGHAAAAGLVALRPATWPWALGALVVDHAALTVAGLWPRCALLGPNLTRLSSAAAARGEVALTIDDGPEPEVTPLLLDLLDLRGARATFFCIGEHVSRYPGLSREIGARGHGIENHSQRHLNRFSVLGPGAMHAEVARAQGTIAEVTGYRPRFFRAPAGLRNPFLEGALRSLDLQLVSWTRRGFDTVSNSSDVVLGRLTRGLGSGDIVLLHDGNAAVTATGQPVVLEVLPRLVGTFRDAGLTTVTLGEALP